jgi:RNA polymerase sigma factor (TIGR02999 family)
MSQDGERCAGAPESASAPDSARMFEVIYAELRSLARLIRGGNPAETLQPTALVHEAYLRIARAPFLAWTSEAHFKSIAALAMRRILNDRARRRCADKRGGRWARVTLSGLEDRSWDCHIEAVDAVLTELEQIDPRMAQLVEMRVFGGMTHDEIGAELGLAGRTVRKDWRVARAWLVTRLREPR